ncbi:SCO2523 family variant P-loop protein [Cryptosporangium arvum]|uniref:ATP-binding protein, CobQ/MinD/ParA family n=1 Tax=Cryptosporangium arvum DSM 44712 TaxID=927661 RepID=A0A010YXI4_9ACTN|nr:SCO2523 family variant P-loop protein [Cryptosporangium arvum]EXG79898.1 ATP-binding protein, CobQ/MinD/ParA family [Cryptosporangium arvum DSM 44712]
MIVFATSDKGGTGRSVTLSNLAYRQALRGADVCYLDFDFGSPTAGAMFTINEVARGTTDGGTHSYLDGSITDPTRRDVWTTTDRDELRERPRGSGRLVLLPGDSGGGEFSRRQNDVERCARLLRKLNEQFDFCLVDLSAGRSYATELVLRAVGTPELATAESRWLVFHRWTRQHIIAASGLVFGEHGLLANGAGDAEGRLGAAVRFVRTAVVDPDSPQLAGLRPEQVAWLRNCNRELQELAGRHKLGRTNTLGSIPLDPVLQWREQLILDDDVFARQVANRATIDAFEELADRLTDKESWEGL